MMCAVNKVYARIYKQRQVASSAAQSIGETLGKINCGKEIQVHGDGGGRMV